jgi:hypothetical protein
MLGHDDPREQFETMPSASKVECFDERISNGWRSEQGLALIARERDVVQSLAWTSTMGSLTRLLVVCRGRVGVHG